MKKFIHDWKGFTLMELMAVAAIVAILAAIGLGTYRRAHEKAILFQALNNLHTLAAATEAYYAENGGYSTNENDTVAPELIPDEAVKMLSESITYHPSRNVFWTRYFVYTLYISQKFTASYGQEGYTNAVDEDGFPILTDGSNHEKMVFRAMRKNGQYMLLVPLLDFPGQENAQDACWANPHKNPNRDREGFELCQAAGFVHCDTNNLCYRESVANEVDLGV